MPGLVEHAYPAAQLFEPSRLVLCDRLLALAEVADRAGCAVTAEHLLALAHTVFDDGEAGRPH